LSARQVSPALWRGNNKLLRARGAFPGCLLPAGARGRLTSGFLHKEKS